MNKGMKQIYDKQMFDIMSNMTNFLKFESIRAKKGTKVDVDIPDFVTRLNRLLYTARVSGVEVPRICLSSLIEYGLPYFGT
jgi:hypothetical protein